MSGEEISATISCNSSNANTSPGKSQSRRGRGRGRGSGRGRGGSGRGRGGTPRKNRKSSPKKTSNNSNGDGLPSHRHSRMADEEVLIQFGQLLRSESAAACDIHERYTTGVISSESEFIEEVRKLLMMNHSSVETVKMNAENRKANNNKKVKDRKSKSKQDVERNDDDAEVDVVESSSNDIQSSDVDVTNKHGDMEEINHIAVELATSAMNEIHLEPSSGKLGRVSVQGETFISAQDPNHENKMSNVVSDIAPINDKSVVPVINSSSDVDQPDKEKILVKALVFRRHPKRLNHPNLGFIRVTSNGAAAKSTKDNGTLVLPPKHHFMAHWTLNVSLLENGDTSGLQVGMFRLGANENTQQHSIIVKDVINVNVAKNGIISGKVPFHAPRAPCEVVLRLFQADDTKKDTNSQVDNDNNQDEDTFLKHVTTLARSSVVYVKCDSSESAADVLRGVLGGIKRGLASPLTNVQNLQAILQSFPCHDHKNLVYGCVNECSKSVYSTTQEFDKLCYEIKCLEEIQEDTDGENHVSNKESVASGKSSSDSTPTSKTKLQKLYAERAATERRIVEVSTHSTYISTRLLC